ncbi:hypothetical protein PW52_12390 [Tamlana sedimentorum]|uniref:Uncharacterized protein n=1 Tax=Neotamlana sedimentorum TaxID=1435349 RepID=A0A0D7W899_9FLAO|nr:hypothetical protein PW52_12390 [Tamlana sedimentorum]
MFEIQFLKTNVALINHKKKTLANALCRINSLYFIEKNKTFNDFIFLLHNIASAILNNKKIEL